jgi:SIR2-like domain
VKAVPLLAKFHTLQAGKQPKRPVRKSLASITQMLFSHYRDAYIRDHQLTTPLSYLQEQTIRSNWLGIIHKELYRDVNLGARRKQMRTHPYLMSFLEIIKTSPLTVNYNFDDTLEKMLLFSRTKEEATKTRGYETTYKPNAQFQNNAGVIYHPNGFLPSPFEEGSSPEVIFSDDAFQDQLISAATGKYVHLSGHLFRNTCLLIGVSLEDATLQNLLRQNAVSNPGHIHYIVHFTAKSAALDLKTRQAIFEANFLSYNLYTLFLDNAGIRNLALLIDQGDSEFRLAFPKKRRKFVYYVVGSVGAGKSTVSANFRNLRTYDEWIDPKKSDLAFPEDELPPAKIPGLDKWIAEQFRKKNYAVVEANEGIHLIDRSPLDPLTFGDPKRRPAKAARLIRVITGTKPIAPGHVIYLDSAVADLKVRNSYKHKYWSDEKLERLLRAIDEIYGPVTKSVVCTRGRNAHEVAREISKVIFVEEYVEYNIQSELEKHARTV